MTKEFQPSPQQQAVFDAIQAGDHNILVDAKAGSGKCLGQGTPVLMFNGQVKRVEDIKVGDFVMGGDGFPQAVTSTTKGTGELIRVTPVKGDSWICNDAHVLTLINSVSGEVFDTTIAEYRKNAGRQRWKDAKLFRVGVDFWESPLTLEPYLVGIWLGDGNTEGPIITAEEKETEIIEYCKSVAPRYGTELVISCDKRATNVLRLRFRVGIRGQAGRNTPNHIWRGLQVCRQDGIKRIPLNYIVNSRDNRLQLLAGLLDTDGYYNNGYYEIATKSPYLALDILYLARSLGLAAYKKIKVVKGREYSRITISGELDQIPCKVPRKQATTREQKKDVTRTGFTLTNIGEGEYYGFTLTGDGRFLLGDFTVTHNTTTIIEGMRYIRPIAGNLLAPSVVFLAFNKNIADTLKSRVPRNVSCSTFHSLGRRALVDSGLVDPKRTRSRDWVNASKAKKLVWNVLDRDDPDVSNVIRLIDVAKGEWPVDFDNPSWWNDLIRRQDVLFDQPKRAVEVACSVIEKTVKDFDTIDFSDMLFLPVFHGVAFDPMDWIFVDEAQDLNGVQHEIVSRLSRGAAVVGTSSTVVGTQPSRLCAVGDPHQAIYAFRGAHADSMEKLAARFSCKTYPLSVSYRCPKAIVKEAQKYLRHESHD